MAWFQAKATETMRTRVCAGVLLHLPYTCATDTYDNQRCRRGQRTRLWQQHERKSSGESMRVIGRARGAANHGRPLFIVWVSEKRPLFPSAGRLLAAARRLPQAYTPTFIL